MSTTSTPQSALAVIPARGGSKRIPRKNIRLLSGRPLIAWAIDAALDSGLFVQVVVSTDDEEIAAISRECGAAVPFVRPAELATDTASTAAVMAHAVRLLGDEGLEFDLACCIYPAAAFITKVDLAEARALLEASDRDYCATLVRYQHPIQRALELAADATVTLLDPLGAAQRTQDLPPRWHDAGQFYWGRRQSWLDGRAILANAVGYELNAGAVQDIDSESDWARAQLLHSLLLADQPAGDARAQ